MNIQEIKFDSKKYLVMRKEIDIEKITDQVMWQDAFGKVHEYIQKHGLKAAGPGVAIYFRWNEPKGKGEIAIGHPVEDLGEIDDQDISLVQVPASEAVTATVNGSYNAFPGHHAMLGKYLGERNAKEILTIEEYIVTGMDTPNQEEWVTNLYHLYQSV